LEEADLEYGRDLDCLTAEDTQNMRPIHAVRPHGLEAWLSGLPASQAKFLRASGFSAKAGQIALLPSDTGFDAAVLGLGTGAGPYVFGALPGGLPPDTDWSIGTGIENTAECVLGFCLGAYRPPSLKTANLRPAHARLAVPEGPAMASTLSAARATWLARDLINTPANLLWPEALASAAKSVLMRNGAHVDVITGEALAAEYPAVHAVGYGSIHKPVVLIARWQSSAVTENTPCVSICGKGVCFDTGGYELRLGCVENMISGDAMRPLDVVRTRSGLTVEIGNTDAEGRLVLCDLLADAAETKPAVLLDFATLTGAARIALGPDLPAMLSNDDELADIFVQAAARQHDHVWRLPLWGDYNNWLDTEMADVNNVSEKAYAGAIIAGLFLQRFVPGDLSWAHFDLYGWNDQARPGRPAGGEAQTMRAAFEGISHLLDIKRLVDRKDGEVAVPKDVTIFGTTLKGY
jgi:leucyl aminopeptidase